MTRTNLDAGITKPLLTHPSNKNPLAEPKYFLSQLTQTQLWGPQPFQTSPFVKRFTCGLYFFCCCSYNRAIKQNVGTEHFCHWRAPDYSNDEQRGQVSKCFNTTLSPRPTHQCHSHTQDEPGCSSPHPFYTPQNIDRTLQTSDSIQTMSFIQRKWSIQHESELILYWQFYTRWTSTYQSICWFCNNVLKKEYAIYCNRFLMTSVFSLIDSLSLKPRNEQSTQQTLPQV